MDRSVKKKMRRYSSTSLLVLLLITILAVGCQGPTGPAGSPGTSSGTISGTVTSSLTQKPVAGVAVTTDPVIKDVTITSGADGGYAAELPIGTYKLTFKKGNFTDATETVTLVAGQTVTKDVVLKLVAAVVVNAGTDQNASPSDNVTLRATTESFDDSTVTGYKWTQIEGVAAKIDNANSATIKVALGNSNAYKQALLTALNPPDRFMVLGINPHALEAAETATFKVTVTTSTNRTYSDMVNVVASLPYVVNTGIQNVPVGLPVLLHSKTQAGFPVIKYPYRWTLTSPSTSNATLDNTNDQNPAFTPDVVGGYVVTEQNSGTTVKVYAGTWAGAISGLDAKRLPLSAGCTVCHDGKTAANQFTAWAASGHAEIFTQNIDNPAGHWSASCASCHTVGYDPAIKNNGFDEAMAAENWKVPSHGEVDYFAGMLKNYPKTASLANIQCENCHGPNNTPLHANKTIDAARVSLSSDVCATCHGEPPRHGRFQQWEESGHGNYEVAIAEGAASSSCARCHGAQGFLTWLKQGNLSLQIQATNGNATAAELTAMGISADTVQPITCVVCHDPHEQGTLSGEPNTATVRIEGDTAMLPAGFKATDVGKGALCITCHNTRNAIHNDANPPTSYGGPHTAAQGDVLMGENAYFVGEGLRSSHSYLKDTCVTCHLEESPPPAEFSYNLSGTNHEFGASTDICSNCHSAALSAEALQAGTEARMEKLAAKMGEYFLKKMPATITIRDYQTPHNFGGNSYALISDYLVVSKANIAAVEWAYIVRQQGFIIKFKSPVTFTYRPTGEAAHSVSLSAVAARLSETTTDGKTVLIPFTDALVKAGWNYLMIEYDASEGIHNPAFTNEVLDASIAALK